MSINNGYRDFTIYTSMSEQHQSFFDDLVKHYGEILNIGNRKSNSLYTLHDFNHHCINIMYIISNVFKIDKLSHLDCFILNIAILFHDISMTEINFDRKIHSLQSKQYLEKEFSNTSTILARDSSPLENNHIKIIGSIIEAHSDIKDDSVLEENNGVRNSILNANYNINVQPKLLAVILRLADELDVANNRLGAKRHANQLEVEVTKDDAMEEDVISLRHWKKLNLITHIKRLSENRTILCLHCDDSYINENKTTDFDDIVNSLIEIKEKIERELISLNDILNSLESHGFYPITSVQIISEDADIKKSLNPPENLVSENSTQKLVDGDSEITKSKPIDNEIASEISAIVQERNLYRGGHFLLNDKYCARDWIDTREIIETDNITHKCIKAFTEHYLENFEDSTNHIFVGLDYEGSVLASKCAFLLKKSFTYIIPAKTEDKNPVSDISNIISGYNEVFLFTDVVSTYETIISAIDKYDLSGKVKAIFSIFYREAKGIKIEVDSSLSGNLYCINNSYDMEIVEKSKCKMQGQTCIALNK